MQGAPEKLTRRPKRPLSALEKPAIDAGFGALDRYRADRPGIELGRAHTANNGVAISLALHGFEAIEKQRLADPVLSFVLVHSCGSKEVGAGRVMAGKPQNALLPDGDEAGDGLPGKRYIDFAGPGLAEILSDPGDDLVLFRRQRAPRRDGRLAQALKNLAGGRQRVKLDQHVHRRRLPSRDQ